MHIDVLKDKTLPSYSVLELNQAIGTLLERGFAPRFLLEATVSKSQLKKGHLWLNLTDGMTSISGVIWSSQLQKVNFSPSEGDGVLIVGKLNFWEARASLVVQIFDIRPSMKTVLRKFEIVKALLTQEGLLDVQRRRPLPKYAQSIAILTSVPSSALADILRTAKERWPLTKLFVLPIPVQGDVAGKIQSALCYLKDFNQTSKIDAVVLARGGGNREDLMVFDNENLCREIADFPVPVVTGLGHEDDLTVADLAADHRAATPTAAIVDLLPSVEIAVEHCLQRKNRLKDYFQWFLKREQQRLLDRRDTWRLEGPTIVVSRKKNSLMQRKELLKALSPYMWLARGFSIVRNSSGKTIKMLEDVSVKERITIQLSNGKVDSIVDQIH